MENTRTATLSPSYSPHHTASMLLFSMRNINKHVSRCCGYELENFMASCSPVDFFSPQGRTPNRLVRTLTRLRKDKPVFIEGSRSIDRDYDFFFVVCQHASDLRYVKLLKNRRDRCRKSVCLLEELWPSKVEESRRNLEVLQGFDYVFTHSRWSVDTLRAITGASCHHLAYGVDALRFVPYPQPARVIDVLNIGRRLPEMHQEFFAASERKEMFYFYDTVSDFSVMDPQEHRAQLANLVQRSRYFITYPPKFDKPGEVGETENLAPRLFEGAAGGAVLLGMPPRCEDFNICFNWPDAVITLPPNAARLAATIAELDRHPATIQRIRHDNVINSLLRHDWVYRWAEILKIVGISSTPQMADRQDRLHSLAQTIDADFRSMQY